MGSQEGWQRKDWTNFFHLRNPGSLGGGRPGGETGPQNRTGGVDQGNELTHYRRKRRRRSLPTMGDRRAEQAEGQ